MSNAAKKIMVRVIKRKMSNGETLEEIFEQYSKLTLEERGELEKAVKEN